MENSKISELVTQGEIINKNSHNKRNMVDSLSESSQFVLFLIQKINNSRNSIHKMKKVKDFNNIFSDHERN